MQSSSFSFFEKFSFSDMTSPRIAVWSHFHSYPEFHLATWKYAAGTLGLKGCAEYWTAFSRKTLLLCLTSGRRKTFTWKQLKLYKQFYICISQHTARHCPTSNKLQTIFFSSSCVSEPLFSLFSHCTMRTWLKVKPLTYSFLKVNPLIYSFLLKTRFSPLSVNYSLGTTVSSASFR